MNKIWSNASGVSLYQTITKDGLVYILKTREKSIRKIILSFGSLVEATEIASGIITMIEEDY